MRERTSEMKKRLPFALILQLLAFVTVLDSGRHTSIAGDGEGSFGLTERDGARTAEAVAWAPGVPLPRPLTDGAGVVFDDQPLDGRVTEPRRGRSRLAAWVSARRTDLVVLAVLAMSIGDTAAALVGKRFGCHKVPWTGKTVEGAAANSIASFATLALVGAWLYRLPPDGFVLPAAAVAILEAALPGEWDNPLAIMLLIGLLAISR